MWSGVIGGAVLAMASHGADQLIVQRLLACRGLRDAQKALIGSGVLVILQFTLFLALGVGLFAFYGGAPIGPGGFASSDAILPTFIVKSLPPFVSAYLVAGIFSAAMCSESSALNSLASALALDIVAPLMGKKYVEGKRGLVLGKLLTLFWTLVLAGLAVGFSRLPQSVPAVQVALGLASVTAGGLLGGVPPRALGAEGASDGRDDRHRDVGGLHVRPVAGLEGLRPVPAREDDRVAVVLAPRLDARVRQRAGCCR